VVSLDTDLHALAGLTAALLGLGALWKGPRLPRNRLFAALCAALAAWNLGVALPSLLGRPRQHLLLLYLAGGCGAPAVAFHFSLITGRPAGRLRSLAAGLGYAAAGGVWVAAALGARQHGSTWFLVAIAVLGALLLLTLVEFVRQVLRLPSGPAKEAHALLLGTAVAAAVAGLSDLVPREDFPRLGPLFLLPFLFVLCGVVLRHRFLDLDAFLARFSALAAGAVIASVLLLIVVRYAGARLLPVFVACFLVLAAAGPLGRFLLAGTRRLLQAESPAARALEESARRLPVAESLPEVWQELERARAALGPEAHVCAHLAQDGTFRPEAVLGTSARPRRFEGDCALAVELRRERAALTLRFVEEEIRVGPGDPTGRLARVAAEMRELDASLVAPLLRGDELAGWLALGGVPEEELTAELAAAMEAVGAQALGSVERLEAREEVRRSETLAALGELAAGLAHEVRNPLGAIRGAAQVLVDSKEAKQETEMLEVIEEETGRLGRVVGEFLAYARPESPRRDAVELEALLRSVLREADAAGLGLATELEIAGGLPPVLGDPDQLHRSFANLVRNAREATGPEGRLRIEARPAESGGVSLRFEDDGPGVEPEQAERVFQPFHTTRSGGTGLGLALVQRVVEAHGGRIDLDPRPGLGAAFTVNLPTKREER
jgi:signal transduction histidine kinase/uncharacterized membrane protein YeaQ/YmgE (transglycosylase-associated protein family)